MMFNSSTGWQRVLFWGVALGSAASLALAALPVVTRISQQDQIWQAASGKIGAETPEPEPVSLQPVLDLAPFGQAALPEDSGAGDLEAEAVISETGDLVLLGVVVGPEPSASMAMISISGAVAASFRIGDDVGGSVLTDVRAEQVTLSVDGQNRILQFPDPLPDQDGADPDAVTGDGFLRNLIPTAAAPDSGATAARVTVFSLLTDLQRDPSSVLQRYGIVDQVGGYAITGSAAPKVMASGLRPGDIVIAINGEALAGNEADWPLLDRAAASGAARITIERGGATQDLTVTLP